MKKFKENYIIGIDHGYGNIKTANHVFKAGFLKSADKPVFQEDMLTYNGSYYLIGEGHREFSPDKIGDEDYFILTLAGMAMELQDERITEAGVHLAAGLPLKWVSQQKKAFTDYLLKETDLRFTFNRKNYHIRIKGVSIFPQGYAAVFDTATTMVGRTVLCDIGNGTMNIMFLKDGVPDKQKLYTEKFGTQQCMNAVRTAIMDRFHAVIDESTVEDFFRKRNADLPKEWAETMLTATKDYVRKVFDILRRYEYQPELMKLCIVGGGGILIRSYGEYDESRVIINDDICATAKGYERWALHRFEKACNER